MEDTAYYITEQCLSLLKKRIQYRNKPFLKQLETNGLVVFKYEDPSLLVNKKNKPSLFFFLFDHRQGICARCHSTPKTLRGSRSRTFSGRQCHQAIVALVQKRILHLGE
jgi:hypothetical protein